MGLAFVLGGGLDLVGIPSCSTACLRSSCSKSARFLAMLASRSISLEVYQFVCDSI
jgi:hypothetical protein